MVYYCVAVECTSHSSKAKKLHIYAFMAGVNVSKVPSIFSVSCAKKMEGTGSVKKE